jgi:hypothetical protein
LLRSGIVQYSSGVAKTLAITSPAGNDLLNSDTQGLHVAWTYSGITNIKIELSTDNGSTWTTLDDAVNVSDGYNDYPISSVVSVQCLIKLTEVGGTTTATSNPFIIVTSAQYVYRAQLSGNTPTETIYVNTFGWTANTWFVNAWDGESGELAYVYDYGGNSRANEEPYPDFSTCLLASSGSALTTPMSGYASGCDAIGISGYNGSTIIVTIISNVAMADL